MKELNDNIFENEITKASKPVVVDFWASWCGPCKMLAPVMEELSEELSTKADFYKVNVDDNPVVSNVLRIASIPTVMIFKEGKPVDTIVGFRPKSELTAYIERNIKDK